MQLNQLRRTAIAAAAVGALAATGAIAVGSGVASAATGCQVSYVVSSQWTGGFGANVTVTNLGDAISSWRLTWSFTAGQTITQLWNGSSTQSGAAVTVNNATWNGAVATGATATFGFNGAWNGSNPEPASFALNGTACTGTVVPSSGPPSSVPPSSVPPSSVPPSSVPPSSTPPGSLPCDLYAAGGTPCVTAHSTTRALFTSYNGPLYQVQRASDKKYLDVGLLSAGGVANGAAQDSFCANTGCTITKIYDQTANHNDLPISWGGLWGGPGANGADVGADAKALPLTVGGQKAYGVKVTPGVGYRVDHAKNAPTGAQPEGIYMVTSSNYVNDQCCFDYGSGENSHTDTGNATMNAIEWGTACWFGTWANNPCVGTGPWVEADLENGMYHTNTGSNKDPNNSGVHFPFVSAWEKNNGTTNFTLKYGNAQSGGLTRPYSGPLPNGYSPMKNDSSILLGTGGDNSHYGVGEFFEGAVTAGYPSDATENAVQTSITSAGYR
jgi:non-reducing end alpha-L-arabinofuranosidase